MLVLLEVVEIRKDIDLPNYPCLLLFSLVCYHLSFDFSILYTISYEVQCGTTISYALGCYSEIIINQVLVRVKGQFITGKIVKLPQAPPPIKFSSLKKFSTYSHSPLASHQCQCFINQQTILLFIFFFFSNFRKSFLYFLIE